jgi:hypothetical protein
LVSFLKLVSWPVYSLRVLPCSLPILELWRWAVDCCYHGRSWDGGSFFGVAELVALRKCHGLWIMMDLSWE